MSNSRIAIVTGASRGLGRALAQGLIDAGWRVVAIARRPDPMLAAAESWAIDLADAPAAAARLAAWLRAQSPVDAVLVNNAATIPAPGPLADTGLDELSQAVRVGLEAPMLLSAAFLAATAGWGTDRRVLHVSSGLGRWPMAGAAAYCAIKAGLDHLARATALEGVRVASLAPGVIDTDMQAQLRHADPARFAEQPRFAALAAQGKLDSADAAAARLLRCLASPDFGREPVADARAS